MKASEVTQNLQGFKLKDGKLPTDMMIEGFNFDLENQELFIGAYRYGRYVEYHVPMEYIWPILVETHNDILDYSNGNLYIEPVTKPDDPQDFKPDVFEGELYLMDYQYDLDFMAILREIILQYGNKYVTLDKQDRFEIGSLTVKNDGDGCFAFQTDSGPHCTRYTEELNPEQVKELMEFLSGSRSE